MDHNFERYIDKINEHIFNKTYLSPFAVCSAKQQENRETVQTSSSYGVGKYQY